MIYFISGGARSGKSRFAEETALALFHNSAGCLYYMATAKQSDNEMVERIRIHQQQRDHGWQTVEEPFELHPFLLTCEKEDVILIDCLTIWLSNVMFERNYHFEEIERAVFSLLDIARKKQLQLLIVSNDVNEGVPSSDEGVLTYMYSLQKLHQMIVKQADVAVEVQVGLATYWKGGGL